MADNAPPKADQKAVTHDDGPNPGPAPDITIDAPQPDPELAPEPKELVVVAEKPVKPPRADRAQQIADRIKKRRQAETAPEFTGDMSDPAQTVGALGMPAAEPEPAPEPAPAAGVDPTPEPAQPQPKRKLKVRGQEVELSEEDLVRYAQIGVAGDDYLREAREKAAEADRILKLAKRTTPAEGQHPDPASAADEGVPEPEPDNRAPPRAKDRLKGIIEDIQFGNDPDAAADNLLEAVRDTAREEHAGLSLREQMAEDFRDTVSEFKEWQGKNKALAEDKNAVAVMERMLYDGYREDLVAIGIPEDRIPQSTVELTDWHRYYRVKGHKVRNAKQLFADTQVNYEKWRGGQARPTPAPTAQPTAPGNGATPGTPVRVAVDRGARRATIPSQPARSAAPQLAPTAPQTEGNSRKAAIQRAKAARGQRVVAA